MSVPALFKPVQLYFSYSEKLKTNNALIAYACLTYAVSESFAIVKQNKDKDAQRFLVGKLDELEAIKANIGGTDSLEKRSEV